MKPFLHLLVALVIILRSHAYPNFKIHAKKEASSDYPKPDAAIMETVQTYISWGSLLGRTMPDCERFQATFGLNRTWTSPFTANEYSVYDIETTCQQLTMNLSWHAASLQEGQYLYPFYTPRLLNNVFWKVGFVWNAVGGSNEIREVFKRKQYDFTIITTLWFQIYPPNNVSYIFDAQDIFWPDAETALPTVLEELVEKYVSFLGGNCKTWAELFWLDVGMVTVSGDDTEYFGPTGLTEYCSKMVYMWSSYVHIIHDRSYSVYSYTNTIDTVAFTWTRTGLYQGRVKTDQILTVFDIEPDRTPTADLKIATADDFLLPATD
ncbi:uncharacterized protein LOC134195888 [Corticium candelabrum]|uniref:uncharacterized protein LOC134195888 n=1 Tax=Corticium candelabrum TaxID=121492 RepID=UPI002E270405|nr:uncharacterized protein LOC134195888 [Corticium candelabrum]